MKRGLELRWMTLLIAVFALLTISSGAFASGAVEGNLDSYWTSSSGSIGEGFRGWALAEAPSGLDSGSSVAPMCGGASCPIVCAEYSKGEHDSGCVIACGAACNLVPNPIARSACLAGCAGLCWVPPYCLRYEPAEWCVNDCANNSRLGAPISSLDIALVH